MSEDPSNRAASTRDVFVSYASRDAAVANPVVEHLEQHGRRCWMAPRDVTPGSQYADEIVGAINDAKLIVLVLSEHAIASPHVGREVERAASKQRRIVALRTDAAPLTRALEYFLSESQWIDVAALGMPAALAKLVEAVGSGPSTPAKLVVPGRSVTGTSGVSTKHVAAVAVVIVVGVLVALGVYFWSLRAGVPSAAVRQLPTTAAISDKSIAVLPFTDMSQKKDQEYFGDGMAEEILDLLAKIPGLTVIGRTSSFQFKGKNEDLRKIGTELNAAYVLEGSVRNSGDQVRVTAQLVNTKTGAHEWSETYDRPIGDVLKLQDAIAAAVVRELQLTVDSGHPNSRSRLGNAEAYDLYLRARHANDRDDQEGYDEAATLFQQALDHDPAFADAAAALADTYVSKVAVGSLTPAAGFDQARRAAEMALSLDEKNVIAHVVVAQIHIIYDWDWAGAERELRQAKTLAPTNVDVLSSGALLAETLGRWEDALSQIKAALAQDPINPEALQELSTIQLARGHLPEAETAMRRALDIRPTYSYGHFILGAILLAREDRDAALHEMEQETQDDGRRQGLSIAYYALGRKVDADVALAETLQKDTELSAFGVAEVYGFRGQTDEAMQWLERAYAQKDAYLYSINRDPLFKNVQGDPRFKAFLKKMNLPE